MQGSAQHFLVGFLRAALGCFARSLGRRRVCARVYALVDIRERLESVMGDNVGPKVKSSTRKFNR